IVLAIVEALIAGAVAVVAMAHHHFEAPLLLALVPAIVSWQAQEFIRRVLYTESRYGGAFINDCISYGGQTLLIIALWFTQGLTGPRAMYALAGTSVVAAAVGLWQIRRSLLLSIDWATISKSWNFGKWLTGGELLQWACSLNMYLWLSAAILGVEASGELKAAQTLFGPTRILAFYLGSVLPMRFARALVYGVHRAVHEQLIDASKRILPLLGAYAVFVAIFSKPLLRLMYGPEFAGNAWVLVLYSGAAFIEYVQVMFTSALAAKHLTRAIFYGQLCGLGITGLLSWWIIHLMGASGAPMALGLSAGIITVMFWRSYKKSMIMDTEETTDVISAAGAEADERHPPANPQQQQARVQLLREAFAALKRNNVPFCVTHGYAELDQRVDSDVDCVIPPSYRPGQLASILRFQRADGSMPQTVQWFADRAHYIAIADGMGRSPEMVQLHVSPDFELNGRIFYTADEIMKSGRPYGDFYVPSAEIEFACILLNRATKGSLKEQHLDRLATLYGENSSACEQEVRRFWSASNAALVVELARNGDFAGLRSVLKHLAADAHRRAARRQVPGLLARKTAAAGRRASRWLRPKAGFHVVFLGPDGVGKSTIIEHVRESISPAFLRTTYHTFAPSLIPHKFQPEKPTPHALPPRTFAASLVKAAWWSVCYTGGYLATIHGERARGGFAMNHRYLLDAIVDPKRYRYSGPTWLLRAIWFIAPKPDLVVLLDAPAEVIQARKKEVAFEETARQRNEYRALLSGMKYGRIINAARPIDEVVAEVNGIILGMLSDRVSKRVGGGT
ncbi:MAG: hypothetical protein ACTHM6_18800, partial [Tepidisphaeraceae bacterium]